MSESCRWSVPYAAKPWRVRWRYLLAHALRVAGWKLLGWAKRRDA